MINGAKPRVQGENFMTNVLGLRNEQERVQKKTFTNWINTYLIQCEPPHKIADLFVEIKDGLKLLLLLEVLSSEKLQKETRTQRIHALSNVRTALSFLESKKIKLVNINPADIVDGKPSIVLGLIWTIILYFQIEEQEDMIMKTLEGSDLAERGEKFKGSAKKALLAWAQNNFLDKYDVKLKDFGTSWRDGAAFSAMVHNIDPTLVDMAQVKNRSNRENLEAAFLAAENGLNIPRLLDPEDVDVDKPDEKSIMTYVAQFLKAYPEGSKKKPKLLEQIEKTQGQVQAAKFAAEQEKVDLNKIREFCGKVDTEMPPAGKPSSDPSGDYQKFLAFLATQKDLQGTYSELLERKKAGHLLLLKPEEMEQAEDEWESAQSRLNEWKWRLDAALPGDFGEVGKWLGEAERCLYQPWPTGTEDEIARSLNLRLAQHTDIFSKFASIRKKFQDAKRQSSSVPNEQLTDIEKRLNKVYHDEPDVLRKLEFLELKYRILAYFIVIEDKLKMWTDKYGKQKDVESLHKDYTDLVVNGKFSDNLDKTIESFKQQSEPYKKRDLAQKPQEAREVDKFYTDSKRKASKFRKEVLYTQTMLEEVISRWKTYNKQYEALHSWLPGAEAALRSSPEERQVFFKDILDWEKRHSELNDSGNFLIESCTDEVAAELKNQLLLINRRWKDLFEDVQKTQKMDSTEKQRKEYIDGSRDICQWLDKNELLVISEVNCESEEIKEAIEMLQTASTQEEAMEGTFKSTSKVAQGLVKDTSEELIAEMLGSLNTIKERLRKIKKDLPERSRQLKGVLPHAESVEQGIGGIKEWIEAGEKLLQSHKSNLDSSSIDQKIQKHKDHFSKSPSVKSSLESKGKVLSKIVSMKVPSLNTEQVEATLDDLNARFKGLCGAANQWETKLNKCSTLFSQFVQASQTVTAWLEGAQEVLRMEDANTEELIEEHNAFFNPKDTTEITKMMPQFIKASSELLEVLEEESAQAQIANQTQTLVAEYEGITTLAPHRLLILMYLMFEEKMQQKLEDGEEEMFKEEKRLEDKENTSVILRDHEIFFYKSDYQTTCQKLLGELVSTNKKLVQFSNGDSEKQDQPAVYEKRFNILWKRVEDMHIKLKNLPQKWKDFENKMNDLNEFVEECFELSKLLQREDISSDEYKSAHTKLMEKVKLLGLQDKSAEEIQSLYKELAPNASPEELDDIEKRLTESLSNFVEVREKVDEVLSKAPVIAKCIEYKEVVEVKEKVLEEAQNSMQEEISLDDTDSVRRYLAERKALLAKLEKEKSDILNNIQEGEILSKNKNAASFVDGTKLGLSNKWNSANSGTLDQILKLEESLNNWQDFDAQKTQLLSYLEDAEFEASNDDQPGGSDAIQTNMHLKENQINKLAEADKKLSEFRNLIDKLKENASEEKQAELDKLLEDFEERLTESNDKLANQVDKLDESAKKWSQLDNDCGNLEDLMKDREVLLKKLNDKSLNPEERHVIAKELAESLEAVDEMLAKLESDGKELIDESSPNVETTKAASRLANLRNSFDKLSKMANGEAKASSQNLSAYEDFLTKAKSLNAFLSGALNYCDSDIPKCTNSGDVDMLLDKHADHLTDRDEIHSLMKELETLAKQFPNNTEVNSLYSSVKKQWEECQSKTDVKSDQLEELKNKFHDLENQSQLFAEKLDELGQLPNNEEPVELNDKISTVKNLKTQLSEYEDQMQELDSKLANLKPNLSGAGQQELMNSHALMKKKLQDISNQVLNRMTSLESLMENKKQVLNEIELFNHWCEKMLAKHEKWNEVFSSQIPEILENLKIIQKECENREATLIQIGQSVTDYCNKSPTDSDNLKSSYSTMSTSFKRVFDLTSTRLGFCEEWLSFDKSRKETKKEVKQLSVLIKETDMSEIELTNLTESVNKVKNKMQDLETQSDDLKKLMQKAELIIKERGSSSPYDFKMEAAEFLRNLSEIEESLSKISNKIQQVQQGLESVKEFETGLYDALVNLNKQLNSLEFSPSTKIGANKINLKISLLEEEFNSYKDDMKDLKGLTSELIVKDPSKTLMINDALNKVQEIWDDVSINLSEKQNLAKLLLDHTEEYEEKKKSVKVLQEKLRKLCDTDMITLSPEDIEKCLQQIKDAEADLSVDQRHLDTMHVKINMICKEGNSFENFEAREIEEELQGLVTSHNQIQDDLRAKKKRLEEQQMLWDSVNQEDDDLASSIDVSRSKLQEGFDNKDNEINIQTKIKEYMIEKEKMMLLKEDLEKKISQIEDNNNGTLVESLRERLRNIDNNIIELDDLSKKLEGKLTEFQDDKQILIDEIEKMDLVLKTLKEQVGLCDDTSGDMNDLIKKLHRLNELSQEVEKADASVEKLAVKANDFYDKCPSSASKSLVKDAHRLTKTTRQLKSASDILLKRLDKSMTGVYEELRIDCENWLGTAQDKVEWALECTSNDPDAINAKLTTMQELLQSVDVGKAKTQAAIQAADLLTTTFPGRTEVEQEKSDIETNFKEFENTLKRTKDLLEKLKTELEEFHHLKNNFESWFKPLEEELKKCKILKATLEDKVSSLEDLKNIKVVSADGNTKLKVLMEKGLQASATSGDDSLENSVHDLQEKFQKFSQSVSESMEELDIRVDDHKDFGKCMEQMKEWLKTAENNLNNIKTIQAPDRDTLQNKFEELQAAMATREDGSTLLLQTAQGGDRVLLGTDTTGRDKIRSDIEQFRRDFDQWNQNLSDLMQQLEASMLQWSDYDDSYQQFVNWLKDLEFSVTADVDLKATLPEKRSQSQLYRNVIHSMNSHAPILDTISDRGHLLSSTHIQNKLNQLKTRFDDVEKAAKKNVQLCEEMVDQHQSYLDSFQVASDWMHATNEKLSVCEDGAFDRSALLLKQDKINSLLLSLNEGEEKISLCLKEGEKTLDQTSDLGQDTIKREMDWLDRGLQSAKQKGALLNEQFTDKLTHLDTFESNYDSFFRFLKDKDTMFKDLQELKQSAGEKERQVSELEVLLGELSDKESDFSNLVSESYDLKDSRLTQQGSQLATRFKNLKTAVQETIMSARRLASDHERYDKEFAELTDKLVEMDKQRSSILNSDHESDSAIVDAINETKKLQNSLYDLESNYLKVIDLGEKLLPFTSLGGRENIQKANNELSQLWNKLSASLSNALLKLEGHNQEMTAFKTLHEQLQQSLSDMEDKLTRLNDEKFTLNDMRSQLQHQKALQQELMSYQHKFTLLTEKVPSGSSDQTESARALQDDYSNLVEESKQLLAKRETAVKGVQTYEDRKEDCQRWLAALAQRIELVKEGDDDCFGLKLKITKFQEILDSLPEGEEKLEGLVSAIEECQEFIGQAHVSQLRSEEEDISKEYSTLAETADNLHKESEENLELLTGVQTLADDLASSIKL